MPAQSRIAPLASTALLLSLLLFASLPVHAADRAPAESPARIVDACLDWLAGLLGLGDASEPTSEAGTDIDPSG